MNFLDAAYEILQKAGRPLHYADITRRAIAANILDTKGQTPEATMGSRLYVDTKLSNSRFRRVSRNVFGLKEAEPSGITQQIKATNQETKAELRRRLSRMRPDRFEALVGELLLALGFEEETLQVTSYTGDSGIDVRGILKVSNITEVNAAVQVKRWQHNVQTRTVRELRGALTTHEQGIIITTSDFSKGAQDEARAIGKTRISLVNGENLLDLLMEFRIGVEVEQFMLFTPDEEWWGAVTGTGDESKTHEPTAEVARVDDGPGSISYPLFIQLSAHEQVFHAELLSTKGQVRLGDAEYASPSKAAQIATQWKSCNGWTLWHYQHPLTGEWRTIDELRS